MPRPSYKHYITCTNLNVAVCLRATYLISSGPDIFWEIWNICKLWSFSIVEHHTVVNSLQLKLQRESSILWLLNSARCSYLPTTSKFHRTPKTLCRFRDSNFFGYPYVSPKPFNKPLAQAQLLYCTLSLSQQWNIPPYIKQRQQTQKIFAVIRFSGWRMKI